ncbi:MAG: hypothetical protein H7831_16795 [Magnetococcus sp. WYHC-3]
MNLRGLVDLHCHMLPGLDDGPAEVSEALAMARMASAFGTGAVVPTPHLDPGRYDLPANLDHLADAFREALAQAGVGLTVHAPGAEVRWGLHVEERLRHGRLPTLNRQGERRWFLLELEARDWPGEALLIRLPQWRDQGYRPILAHPERHNLLRSHPQWLASWVQAGGMVQVTAAAYTGGFGETTRQVAEDWLRRGWVHLLASDGHGYHHRQPVMADGVREVAHLAGGSVAERLGRENALAILRGEELS